jgi:hypothetical protein
VKAIALGVVLLSAVGAMAHGQAAPASALRVPAFEVDAKWPRALSMKEMNSRLTGATSSAPVG